MMKHLNSKTGKILVREHRRFMNLSNELMDSGYVRDAKKVRLAAEKLEEVGFAITKRREKETITVTDKH